MYSKTCEIKLPNNLESRSKRNPTLSFKLISDLEKTTLNP